MDVNRDVSPLGNHTLTISVTDDKGFMAETIVPYFLAENIKPIGNSTINIDRTHQSNDSTIHIGRKHQTISQ